MNNNNSKDKNVIPILIAVFILGLALILNYKAVNVVYVVNDNLSISTGSAVLVESEEKQEIHDGTFYNVRNYDVLGSSDSLGFVFYTEDSEVHIVMSVSNEYNANYTLIENATIISNGTVVDYYNRNRNYGDSSDITIYKNPQFSGGLHLASNSFGDSGWRWSTGGGDADVNEYVLAPHRNYVLYIDNLYTSDNIINYVFDWSTQ